MYSHVNGCNQRKQSAGNDFTECRKPRDFPEIPLKMLDVLSIFKQQKLFILRTTSYRHAAYNTRLNYREKSAVLTKQRDDFARNFTDGCSNAKQAPQFAFIHHYRGLHEAMRAHTGIEVIFGFFVRYLIVN